MNFTTQADPNGPSGGVQSRDPTKRSWIEGGVAAVALAAATAATFAGLCCIGPLTILLLGAGGAVAAAGLAPYRGPLLALSGILIAAGYWLAFRSKSGSAACSVRAGRWIRVSLVVACLAWVVGVALWMVER